MLQSSFGTTSDIVVEAVAYLRAFLLRREAQLDVLEEKSIAAPQQAIEQDSFGELWPDDELYNDAALNAAMGIPAASDAAASDITLDSFKNADKELAQGPAASICRAVFATLSNIFHEDNPTGLSVTLGADDALVGKALEHRRLDTGFVDFLSRLDRQRAVLEGLTDIWAGFASIQVANGVKKWDDFLGMREQSWQRLPSSLGSRDVGLRFVLNVVDLDPKVLRTHTDEVLKIWFRSIGARLVSVQPALTDLLRKADPPLPFFHLLGDHTSELIQSTQSQVPDGQHVRLGTKASREVFLQQRLFLLRATVQNMRASSQQDRKLVFSLLPHLFRSLQDELDSQRGGMPQGPVTSSDWEYVVDFVGCFVRDHFREDLGEALWSSSALVHVKKQWEAVKAKVAELEASRPVVVQLEPEQVPSGDAGRDAADEDI